MCIYIYIYTYIHVYVHASLSLSIYIYIYMYIICFNKQLISFFCVIFWMREVSGLGGPRVGNGT